jgi:ubiquinone/menaquinone biosynthesis C-methylase UbiE
VKREALTSARDQFDRQAGKYNERWASWSDETLRRLLELADPQPDWRVLDVATGTGFTALAVAPHVRHVVGSDVSPNMLAEAHKRAETAGVTNVDWVEAPAEALPFDDAAFDLVTARIAPHHFSDVPAFLAETRRVLTPGGVFVLADTTVPDDELEAADWQNAVERERDGSHVANLSPETWRRLVIEAGFVVTDLDCSGGGIGLELSAWLETAGCAGVRADRVRQLFATAPEAARRAFQITTNANGETRFVWQRVVLRAVAQ